MKNQKEIYPFSCIVVGPDSTFTVDVMKVTQKSILVNTKAEVLVTNSSYQVKFNLPLLKNGQVESEAVVFKTYDSFKGKHGEEQPGNHIVEMVFKNLSDLCRQQIITFVANTTGPGFI